MIDSSYILKLYQGLPRRILAVIDAKGEPKKYRVLSKVKSFFLVLFVISLLLNLSIYTITLTETISFRKFWRLFGWPFTGTFCL